MLLVTFCKVKPAEFKVTRLSWLLLSIQIFGSIAVYLALSPFSTDVAQGAFICVFCPTATAAPVITGMLGGSVPRLATFSIISNMAVAISAPILFPAITGAHAATGTLATSFLTIGIKVFPAHNRPAGTGILFAVYPPGRTQGHRLTPVRIVLHMGSIAFHRGGACGKLHNGRAVWTYTGNGRTRPCGGTDVHGAILCRTGDRQALRRPHSRGLRDWGRKTQSWPSGWH